MLLATLAGMLALAQPTPEETAWIKSRAIPFDTPEAGHGFKDLEPLRALIGDARIVSLGEPTHGTREAFQMKHRLLEFLATEMGFSIFSIEASMPEAYRLNGYVLRGVGDPRAGIKGMYFWTWDTEEVLAMVEWMRGFNASGMGPLQFTGFDMQFEKVAKANARDLVAQAEPEYLAQLDEQYAKVDGRLLQHGGGEAGVATGTLPAALARGKRVRYTAWVRTDAVDGFAGLWMRADGPDGEVLAFGNMAETGPRGTTPWTQHTLELDIPAETQNINFGMLMQGTGGSAWFDDLSVEVGDVSFRDPAALDFSFESGRLVGFFSGTPSFKPEVVAENPHGGERCFRLSAPPMLVGVKAAEARQAAEDVLAHMEAAQARYAERTSPERAAWGVQNARVVAQCMRMYQGMAERNQEDSLQRDFSMAANVKWILDQNPGAKIVLWAHNGHVARGPFAMGQYLERLLPGQQVVVGFSTSEGEYTAIKRGRGLTVNPLQPPTPGSVEEYLDSADMPRLILDVRGASADDPASAWLTTDRDFRMVGALAMDQQLFPRTMKGAFDLLVHIRRTAASRSLGQVVRPE
jgi:erythromycin esterase-like protein